MTDAGSGVSARANRLFNCNWQIRSPCFISKIITIELMERSTITDIDGITSCARARSSAFDRCEFYKVFFNLCSSTDHQRRVRLDIVARRCTRRAIKVFVVCLTMMNDSLFGEQRHRTTDNDLRPLEEEVREF